MICIGKIDLKRAYNSLTCGCRRTRACARAADPRRWAYNRNKIMPQNRESGARANEYGRVTARKIAATIGAISTSQTSNEFELGGKKITIRCARSTTTNFGVPFKMLDRVDSIFGAIEQENGTYEIYELSMKTFAENMRDTRSKGPSAGKVGLVNRSLFISQGRYLRTVEL